MSLSPTPHSALAGKDEYLIEGIRVERYPRSGPGPSVPLICVHGGGQASWCWDDFAPVLQQGGFDVHALNWRGRNGSAAVDPEWFLTASIADVVKDIAAVAAQFEQPPILIGHSMGGLACQLYAQDFPVKALLLLTPVVPSQVNAPIIELPIDYSMPWGPLPLEMAKALFFQGLDDAQCAHFYPMLVPESPLRCFEATRWTLPVTVERIRMPTLIISGALDALTPASTGQRLAELFGAEHRLETALGHNVLLGQGGKDVAQSVLPWLASHT
ncbi:MULTISPECIES: alpha/beta fold hydrolase [unclassified Pseudomonas]|uniref:alpha/beta fold hydrolase n=1 Tax=unclassified Pseudomonas TaxID=196821 RepID=UPI0015A43B61|nr:MULTISPECIES: alpha/beta hydrolase [unclassified Pseudomonas]NWC93064.1 alpha/beta hydrolase [Pseudomonas sp. IPO3779]NWD19482.1 alpha/beta hydrolase [Pseudomonas sp. IPO3778]